jgi:carbonic anhydrase/acetyltransferase-like protein (isoleucine patch superfamily)
MGALVLNGAKIGEGSIIGAGAVITEHTVVPANTLWAGVPAKERRRLEPEERELILQYARNYVDYSANYLKERES